MTRIVLPLGGPRLTPGTDRLRRAVTMLESRLAAGPQPARTILDAARADGLPVHILDLAKQRVGVRTHRVAGRWEWSILRGFTR